MSYQRVTMWISILVFAACVSDIQCRTNFVDSLPEQILISLNPPRTPDLKFGELAGVDVDYGNLSSRPIDLIKEDKYRRGSFFFTQGSALMRYTPGEPVSLVLGSTEFIRPFQHNDGTSQEARFSLIGDVVQYSETKMAISDFANNCVREYDFITDIVSTLIGVCDQLFSTGPLEPNKTVNASTRFLVGPTNMEYIEATRSLIVLDFGYKQIAKYDFDTDTAELLGESLFQQLPNSLSILLNSDDTKLYVAHSYGVSVVDLATSVVTMLVGERVHDRGISNSPLLAGSFSQASVGKVESLTWLVQDQVLAFIRPEHTEALIFMDLIKRQVGTQCVGSDESLVTVTGDASRCSLNTPTAITAINNTIYLATLAEGNYDTYKFSSPSLWFSMNTTHNFCTLANREQYQRFRPRRVRYSKNESVKVKCRGDGYKMITCVAGTYGSAEWDQPLPDCQLTLANVQRRFIRRRRL